MRHVDPSALTYLGPPVAAELTLPMVATKVCAGFPSPADDFMDDEVDLQRILVPNRPATFLWRVSGHSMVEAGIHDGDVVVVDRSLGPEPGQVVVVAINGEVSLKAYRKGGTLAFANKAMPAFAADAGDQIEVWGVVTWTLHKPRA